MTNNPHTPTTPEVIDYEGSTYRTDFWEGKGRDYEDAVERAALRRLLPAAARRYVDFGGGFGRLINEADRYEQVVVLDYSSTMLKDAQARLGRSPRYTYVNADLYRLPFMPNTFDAGLLCRTRRPQTDSVNLCAGRGVRARICQQTQPEGHAPLRAPAAKVESV
jgi:SAM-dependent methyltransferase